MSYNRSNDSLLVKDYNEGLSWEALMSKYECSVTTVHDVLKRNGVSRKRILEKCWTKQQDELFIKMYLENKPYPEIGKAFNIKGSTITWHVHRLQLPMRGSGRKNTWVNKFAENTNEAHYWLGYIFADGHITYTNRSFAVNLYSEKRYVIDKFISWFGEGVHVYTKEYMTKNGKTKTLYQASIGSKLISEWMINSIGLSSNKHHTLNPNIEINWDIIRGYFDGDGCASPERYMSLKSCSRVWLERIQSFLLENGIESKVQLSYKDCYGLFIYKYENLKRILELMYAYPYYCHEYKRENLANRVAVMRQRKSGELLEA